jgi:hypothetical protein
MKRKIYHVVWRDKEWHVRRARVRRPSISQKLKCSAVWFAELFAIESGTSTQVIVHGKNGRIQTEWTYGKGPRRSRG